MILLGKTGQDAEIPFNLFRSSDGTAITGYTFSTGDVKYATPGSPMVDAPIINIREVGRGKYALQLEGLDTATSGAVYLDVNTAQTNGGDCLPSSWAESIIDVSVNVLDALLTDHTIGGSVGEALAIAIGLLQGNFFIDTVTNTPDGQTAARLRLFRTGTAARAATPGGSGEGEFKTFTQTTVYAAAGAIFTHLVSDDAT